MKPQTRNRVILFVSLGVAGTALAVLALGNSIGENLVYYWSPSEMAAQGTKAHGPTIRLGGVVKPQSIEWNAQHTALSFRVADSHSPEATSVLVRSNQVPPQMFREGIGVVVEGKYDKSETFTAQRLMVNHSNEYRPPKPGEKPSEDWKKEAERTMSQAPGEAGK